MCGTLNVHTHILVGGLVGADQVGMEAWEAHYGPDREETHHHLQYSDTKKLRKIRPCTVFNLCVHSFSKPQNPAQHKPIQGSKGKAMDADYYWYWSIIETRAVPVLPIVPSSQFM